jgi:hypothetical protein
MKLNPARACYIPALITAILSVIFYLIDNNAINLFRISASCFFIAMAGLILAIAEQRGIIVYKAD